MNLVSTFGDPVLYQWVTHISMLTDSKRDRYMNSDKNKNIDSNRERQTQ